MKIGAVFPFRDLAPDPSEVRDFVQAVEQMGFDNLLVYDHVIGANPASRPGWDMPYINTTPFYEPLTLFAFLAGLTERIELVSAVMILAQRQAVLVAKQAATADVLAKGRLRLGVGTGWSTVEYEALGAEFDRRGEMLDEQIAVMRALWADQTITFRGKYHTVTDAGMAPVPPRRTIPIWIGGTSPPAIRRAARIGDGWLPYAHPSGAEALMDQLAAALEAEGRDRRTFGVECLLFAHPDDRPDFGHPARTAEQALEDAEVWRRLGVSAISVHSMASAASDLKGHLEFMRRFAEGFSR
jgi:probable F420-dependent oxidoreductase